MALLLEQNGQKEQALALMRSELNFLDLYSFQIGDVGAQIISNFIEVDETVKILYLRYCKIGLCGAKSFAAALTQNKTVEFLWLDGNYLGSLGANVFIDALRHNVSLRGLKVLLNSIPPESIATIEYLTETRNAILIPAAVRLVSLYLISARRAIADAGNLAIFPKEIVKMIAMEVWATRKDPKWLEALSESERNGQSTD